MPIRVTITHTSRNPDTIAAVLARRIGREPSHAELCAEVRRILTGAAIRD